MNTLMYEYILIQEFIKIGLHTRRDPGGDILIL